jgi:hypothetical protein
MDEKIRIFSHLSKKCKVSVLTLTRMLSSHAIIILGVAHLCAQVCILS